MDATQAQPAVVPAPANQAQTPTTELIQQYLEDNERLIHAVMENMAAGRLESVAKYQQRLQQNLMYLASVADSYQPTATAQPQGGAQQPQSAVQQPHSGVQQQTPAVQQPQAAVQQPQPGALQPQPAAQPPLEHAAVPVPPNAGITLVQPLPHGAQ
eukprot:jgi/Botrbrau1/2346/Bobra.39_1s0033.1